jgi:hypothetical protein
LLVVRLELLLMGGKAVAVVLVDLEQVLDYQLLLVLHTQLL